MTPDGERIRLLEDRIADLESTISDWAYLTIEVLGWDGPCPGDDDYERVA